MVEENAETLKAEMLKAARAFKAGGRTYEESITRVRALSEGAYLRPLPKRERPGKAPLANGMRFGRILLPDEVTGYRARVFSRLEATWSI